MSTAEHRTFACPRCGKAFIWASRLAGTRISCPCGGRFVMPATPPPKPQAYDAAAQELLEEIPSTTSSPRKPPPRTLGYESKPPRPETDFASVLRPLFSARAIFPVVLIVAGIVARFSLPYFLSSPGLARMGMGVLPTALALGVSVVAALAGVAIVAQMTGADLGSLPITALWLCAIGVLDSILFVAVASVDNSAEGIRGLVLAWHAVLLFNWVMFATLFEFDTQESLFACAAVGILQAVAPCISWYQ